MTDLKRRMASGAAWLVLLRFLERGIGVISTIVLARLLVPADFGVVAMAMSVYAALEIMTAFSFDLALIQNRDAGRDHYNTAWTFNALFGLGLMVGLVALAWPTAAFYADPRVAPVMMVLGIAAAIRGFENIGIIEFQRDLNLAQEFKIGLARKVGGFVVTIAAALAWESYWALIAGILAQRLIGLLMSFTMHPFRPRFSFAAKAELLSFTKWLALNNVVLFVVHRANDFIIGRQAGPTALGAYNISYEVANLPTTELVFPIGRALFPGFSSMAHDKVQLKSVYLQVLSLIAWFTLPVSIGMMMLAEPLVLLLLGEKWQAAVPLIQILVVFGAVRSLTSNSGNVFLALNMPGTITRMSLLYLAILLPLSIWATREHGAIGAAAAVAIAIVLQFFVVVHSVAKVLHITVVEHLGTVWRPVLGSALTGALLWWLEARLRAGGLAPWIRLLGGSLAGAVCYLAAVGSLWGLSGRKAGTETLLLRVASRFGPSRAA